MKHIGHKLLLSASCLACATMSFKFDYLEGTEFAGGHITSHLLDAYDIGSLLFLLALIFAFIKLRNASICALLACLLCLPFYFYFLAPGIFRKIFVGEYSVALTSAFVWDQWVFIDIV